MHDYYVAFVYFLFYRLGIGELRVMCGGGGGVRGHMSFHLHVVGLVQ
jgi:hypothetical protein